MILYYRKLASVAALVATLCTLSTLPSMSAASDQMPSSIFDIPLKSEQELKSIIDDLPNIRKNMNMEYNFNSPSHSNSNNKTKSRPSIPTTPEEKAQEKLNRSQRHASRRANAKKLISEHQPDPGILTRMKPEDIRRVYRNAAKPDSEGNTDLQDENHRWLRDLGSGTTNGMDTPSYMAAVDEYYDPFAQGYRMLGGFIDCDNQSDGGGSGDNNGGDGACSRWMMWAAVSQNLI